MANQELSIITADQENLPDDPSRRSFLIGGAALTGTLLFGCKPIEAPSLLEDLKIFTSLPLVGKEWVQMIDGSGEGLVYAVWMEKNRKSLVLSLKSSLAFVEVSTDQVEINGKSIEEYEMDRVADMLAYRLLFPTILPQNFWVMKNEPVTALISENGRLGLVAAKVSTSIIEESNLIPIDYRDERGGWVTKRVTPILVFLFPNTVARSCAGSLPLREDLLNDEVLDFKGQDADGYRILVTRANDVFRGRKTPDFMKFAALYREVEGGPEYAIHSLTRENLMVRLFFLDK